MGFNRLEHIVYSRPQAPDCPPIRRTRNFPRIEGANLWHFNMPSHCTLKSIKHGN